MKQIKFIFSKVLFPASFFFTMYSIFAYLVNSTTDEGKSLLNSFLLVLSYCIIIALANNIFKTELSMPLKVALHYSAFLIPLIAIVVITDKNHLLVPVFSLVTIVYALIASPVLIIRAIINRKANDEQKYDSQFK